MGDARRAAFRCSVAPENSSATLIAKGKKFQVRVLDTSREGFTIQVSERLVSKLANGQVLRLLFNGENWEVRKQSHYNDDGSVNVGLQRIRELTKIKIPSNWFRFFQKSPGTGDPTLAVYLMIAFLIACIALPGLGDNLGTAPRIRDGVQAVVKALKDLW